jgi:rhomboid protease GluP
MTTTTLKKKFKLLYIPYLLTTIGICGLYTFLNWLLIIKLQLFSVKEIVINFWIPIALPAIPVLLYFRPKLKLLNLKTKKGNGRDFYIFIIWIALFIPTMIAQEYITKASGKLTQLDTINNISKQELSKYYTLKKIYINKSYIGSYSSFEVSGKHNEHFNMNLYVVLPIFAGETDTAETTCMAWLGIKYSKQISNRLEQKEKEEQYQEFAHQSQMDFDTKDLNQFIYLERVGNTDDRDGYNEAVRACPKYFSDEISILLPVNESFEKRLGNTLPWFFGVLGIGSLVWLIMILIPKFDQKELDLLESGVPAEKKDLKESLDFLVPKEGYFITPILIHINVIVYLLMIFAGLGFISFNTPDLYKWGGNYGPATVGGQWWRLLTNIFLHGGLMHLVANMFGLLFVGLILEPIMGRTKYLLLYLLTGILASCASIWWYDAKVSVGASGAIFGLYGIFLALLLTKVFTPEFAKSFLISTLVFVGYNLLMGLAGGIDNAAHIGGLLSGFIAGLIFRMTLKKQEDGLESNERSDP